jgi:hypothetical protein
MIIIKIILIMKMIKFVKNLKKICLNIMIFIFFKETIFLQIINLNLNLNLIKYN